MSCHMERVQNRGVEVWIYYENFLKVEIKCSKISIVYSWCKSLITIFSILIASESM